MRQLWGKLKRNREISRSPAATPRRGFSRSPDGSSGSAQSDADGAVIAAQNLRMNRRALHRAAQDGRRQKIVDSPPDVARPGVRKMTPPRIVAVSLRKEAERIDEPRIHHILK